MSLSRTHLNAKSRNVNISEYLRECIEKYEVTPFDYDCLRRHNEDFRALNNDFIDDIKISLAIN